MIMQVGWFEVVIVSNARTRVKRDIKMVFGSWKNQPSLFKLLDLSALVGIIAFLVLFIFLKLSDLALSPGNTAIVLYPLFVAGLSATIRTQLSENPKTKPKAIFDWVVSIIIISVLVLIVAVFLKY